MKQGENIFIERCLKEERDGVVLDQPQPVSKFWHPGVFSPCGGWSSTQPRSQLSGDPLIWQTVRTGPTNLSVLAAMLALAVTFEDIYRLTKWGDPFK